MKNYQTIQFKKLHPDAIIPEYRHDGDSGFDLHCLNEVTINPGECKLVPTGLAMALPKGFELQLRMRSGFENSAYSWQRTSNSGFLLSRRHRSCSP